MCNPQPYSIFRMAPPTTQERKIYPSRAKGVVHPCRAKGMKYVYFFVSAERKEKLKRYCKMKRMTQTELFSRFLAKELSENYDEVYRVYSKRERVRQRGRAYRYVLAHSRQSVK
ncbi:hypothetical protein GO755_39025 [Spirosoma sp. HMF4905]|uniref:Protein CopB n=1 Tax=Spirosoma arboris TaxID=2682092 RepID=A0A7K1SQJ5_9BACT|nr:RepB family protein [Spirosoma arboris]MVM36072.1 hypothetical protein [Spirosoma arboris]